MPIETARLHQVIVEAMALAADVAPEDIDDDANLFDLGLDSLSFATILIDIEDAVGAEVPSELLDRFLEVGDTVTVKDVLRLLSSWDPGQPLVVAAPASIVVRRP